MFDDDDDDDDDDDEHSVAVQRVRPNVFAMPKCREKS